MPFWKIVVEYEGTNFAGWQVQPRARTVQGELDRALSTVLRERVRVQVTPWQLERYLPIL